MAKPIQLDFPARDHHAELLQRLADAPAQHAAAILEFLELLEELHRRNVLSTLRGAVGAGGDLVGQLSQAAAQPESVRAMRNAIALAKILSQIDPDLIGAIQKAIASESPAHRNSGNATPSLWKIAKTLGSPKLRRALFAGALVLVAVGGYLEKRQSRSS
jgi:uncharacterized protein YjgD (DUF1641 family)